MVYCVLNKVWVGQVYLTMTINMNAKTEDFPLEPFLCP